MKNKIEQLEVLRVNLEVMIEILKEEWRKKELSGAGTIRKQIRCYGSEGWGEI